MCETTTLAVAGSASPKPSFVSVFACEFLASLKALSAKVVYAAHDHVVVVVVVVAAAYTVTQGCMHTGGHGRG